MKIKYLLQVMALLKNIITSRRSNISDVMLYLVDLIGTSVLNCYMRVHDHHPHKQQTISFLQDLFGSLHGSPHLKNRAVIMFDENTTYIYENT
jgi:hypothetical protein